MVDGSLRPLGTPASSTTKAGRHDIAEILVKVAQDTKNQIKSIYIGGVLIKVLVSRCAKPKIITLVLLLLC
jgi:hypothetical protein